MTDKKIKKQKKCVENIYKIWNKAERSFKNPSIPGRGKPETGDLKKAVNADLD